MQMGGRTLAPSPKTTFVLVFDKGQRSHGGSSIFARIGRSPTSPTRSSSSTQNKAVCPLTDDDSTVPTARLAIEIAL